MRRSNPIAIAILLLVLLLPPAYVASVGPAIWCRDRGIISQETMGTLYWPVSAGFRLPVVGRALQWYCDHWYTPKQSPA